MNYKAYIFDYDYTLAFSEPAILICYRYVFDTFGFANISDEKIEVNYEINQKLPLPLGLSSSACRQSLEFASLLKQILNSNKKRQVKKIQFGFPLRSVKVCPQAFYSMQINSDGKIVGCHAVYYPRILDDCNTKNLVDIWNGSGYSAFQLDMPGGRKNVCKFCDECKINDFRIFLEDDILLNWQNPHRLCGLFAG